MIALLLALALDDPAPPKRQEEPPPRLVVQEEPAPPRLDEDAGGGFLDFDWLELQFRAGFAAFTDDFRADPAFQASVCARAPMPWLSPASDPGGEYFGAFLGVGLIMGVDRDLNPPPSGADGNVFMVNAGIDFTFLRNQSLYLALEAGGQYTNYGGIDGLEDGLAPLAGLAFGLYAGGGLTLTLGEQTVFGNGGDRIYLINLGLVVEF
jgi:hypothetical protein